MGKLFQFKHISFQEALFAIAYVDGAVGSTWDALGALEQPFCEPMPHNSMSMPPPVRQFRCENPD
eukprot:3674258-Prymnesium_polylepis.2